MIAEKKQGRGGPAWLSGIWVFYLLNLVLQVLYDLIYGFFPILRQRIIQAWACPFTPFTPCPRSALSSRIFGTIGLCSSLFRPSPSIFSALEKDHPLTPFKKLPRYSLGTGRYQTGVRTRAMQKNRTLSAAGGMGLFLQGLS
jgi:hypothetical protein